MGLLGGLNFVRPSVPRLRVLLRRGCASGDQQECGREKCSSRRPPTIECPVPHPEHERHGMFPSVVHVVVSPHASLRREDFQLAKKDSRGEGGAVVRILGLQPPLSRAA